MLRAQLVRRLTKEPGILLSPANIVIDGLVSVVTGLEFLQHHLA
jgi:hypothetical protein